MPLRIGAIILAAGESKRLGTPKQLLQFQGRTLIERAIEAASRVCSPVVTVIGANAERIREVIPNGARVVCNERWAEGMASSIQAGLAVIGPEIDVALLMLCDQPLVDANILRRIVGKSGDGIVAAEYDGTIGVPAVFGRDYFSELRALKGQEGAKKILLKYETVVTRVPLPECAFDVDTMEDYERLVATAPPSRLKPGQHT